MYKPTWLRAVILFLLLLSASCASAASSAPGPGAPQTPSPVSDEELNAAIKEAQGTMSTLLQAVLAPKASYDFLGVKVRFTKQDGGYDDNWVEPVDYYDGIFTIRMMDGLTYNTNLHPDRTLDVPAKKVVDWMIVEKDGTLIGGYTIRLSYEHMTQEQRDEFLRVTGYKME